MEIGQAVDKSLASRVSIHRIDIRDGNGRQLSSCEIDLAVFQAAADAAMAGAHVIVHLVAHSKTGIHAPSLDAIRCLKAEMQNDVTIVVDAAQGRLAPEAYQTVLKGGSLLSLTGSKFFGGPPFCGALLVPSNCQPSGRGLKQLPSGFNDYFSRDALPESWTQLRSQCDDWFNTGLLLRWTAAIAEMTAFFQVDPEILKVVFSLSLIHI